MLSLLAPDIPTKMFCVSDDIDGLRKVPDNLPNQELITANLGKPLTSVPDPFGTHESWSSYEWAFACFRFFWFDYELFQLLKNISQVLLMKLC